jgi:hypothetical protein
MLNPHLSQASVSVGSSPSDVSGGVVISSVAVESGSRPAVDTRKSELPPEEAIGDVYCIVLHALGTGDPVVSPTLKSCLCS